jgi:iron complex outermembrane receptor protein
VIAQTTKDSTAVTQSPSPGESSEVTIQEVIVTAERREENLQTVPIAITAVSNEELQGQGITNTQGLSQAVPGLVFSQSFAGATPFLRGVGTTSALIGEEPSVAVYIDDVYIASPMGDIFSFNNISGIDVLKGPQGTLFGRNASGGVIQINTLDPQQTPAARVSVGYGNFQTWSGSAYATSGVTDNLSADLAIQGTDQSQGWGRDLTTGQEAFTSHDISARTKWLWHPSDTTRISLSADYARAGNEMGEGFHLAPGSIGVDRHSTFDGFYNTYDTENDFSTVTQAGVSLSIRQEAGPVILKSITAYRSLSLDYHFDQDVVPAYLLETILDEAQDTFSQEVQITSSANAWLQWVAGGYYFDDLAKGDPITNEGSTVAGASQQYRTRQKTDSIAGFLQATAPLGFRTRLTGGVRYTRDDKDISGDLTEGVDAPKILRTASQSLDADKATYRGSLDHQFTDNVMGYVSYNTGFKSGIFNTIVFYAPPVKPEEVKAAELGLKTDLLEHRARFDMSVFDSQYTNIQLSEIENGVGVLINAAAARIKGGDADLSVIPIKNLDFSAGVSYLDGAYTSFPNAPYFVVTSHGATQIARDATGNQTIQTPKVTFSTSIGYTWYSQWGSIKGTLSDAYNSGFNWDAGGEVKQTAYNLVGTNLRWTDVDSKWGFEVYGSNLLNKEYLADARPTTFGIEESPAPPRTYGVRIHWQFH